MVARGGSHSPDVHIAATRRRRRDRLQLAPAPFVDWLCPMPPPPPPSYGHGSTTCSTSCLSRQSSIEWPQANLLPAAHAAPRRLLR